MLALKYTKYSYLHMYNTTLSTLVVFKREVPPPIESGFT